MRHALIFLQLIEPYLVGNKKDYAKLVIQFISQRIEGKLKYQSKRNELGRYINGHSPDYSSYDICLYNQYKELRDPQRLHAMPLPSYFQKRVKI